ncbi:MAG TPA: hypothetical protein VF510_26220 [Ktedonobacterales bacterium]
MKHSPQVAIPPTQQARQPYPPHNQSDLHTTGKHPGNDSGNISGKTGNKIGKSGNISGKTGQPQVP